MSISSTSSNITKSSNSIELYQGESKDLDLLIVEEVKDINGIYVEQAVDLTNVTLYFSVRLKASAPELLISKTSVNLLEIEIATPKSLGAATIHISSADTKYLDAGDYVFDVWALLSSGKRVPVVEISEFIIKESVTKAP